MNFRKPLLTLVLLPLAVAAHAGASSGTPSAAPVAACEPAARKHSKPVKAKPGQKQRNLIAERKHVAQLQQQAANGDSAAQYELGVRYLNGTGVPKDYAVAYGWLNRSATMNNADAQFTLAGMYDEGRGVAQDYRKAAEWNFKAAERGHAGAQYNLGSMYIRGDGIPPDILKAHMWFNLSASQGNTAALDGKARSEARMSPWQLEEAQVLARAWQEKRR